MPRVTFDHYLEQRHFLTRLWKHCRIAFATLSPAHQDALHTYFRPSEQLRERELRTYLDHLRRTHPSAANQGGKAYVRLLRIYSYAYTHCHDDSEDLHRILTALAPRAVSQQKSGKQVSVAGVRRHGPEVGRLVSAYVQLIAEESLAPTNPTGSSTSKTAE